MAGRRTFVSFFEALPDPRVRRCRRHALLDIIVLALVAVVAGAQGWEDIYRFGVAKREWLEERLGLAFEEGVAGHDTIRRVFARLDPEAFRDCLRSWACALGNQTQGRLLNLDGKTLRRSFDRAAGQEAMQMVRVWSEANRLVIGTLRAEAKSNEIPAARALLDMLDLRGAIVTADAAHAQKETVRQIRRRGGDYLLGLKCNQPSLHAAVRALLENLQRHPAAAKEWEQQAKGRRIGGAREDDQGHGRQERRLTTTVVLAPQDPDWQDLQREWPGLRTLIQVVRTRRTAEKETTERAYWVSSLLASPARLGRMVRAHWSIENRLHYPLDVTFREDDCRIRSGHGPENFATLRDLAFNAISRRPASEGSMRARRQLAAWNEDYLLQVLLSAEPHAPPT